MAVVAVSSFATGASFTGVTLKVMVFGLLSKAPALSWTLKVKLVYGLPLPSLDGVNTSLLRSAAAITWPALTATPFRLRLPEAGVLSMRTPCRLCPASASLNTKSAALKA